MSVINQKEYLRKYLSIGSEPGKKKKKKRVVKTDRLKIIDDDVDDKNFTKSVQEDLMGADEDAPQIVGVVDDRPLQLKLEDYRKSGLWKPAIIDLDDYDDSHFQNSNNKDIKVENTSKLVDIKEEILSPTNSPLRQEDSSPPRRKTKTNDEDVSQPRKQKRNQEESPPRKKIVNSNRDISPPRRIINANRDISPPRRVKHNKEYNLSPPRKIKQESLSPPRRNERMHGKKSGDSNPPRRIKEEDLTPPRRNKKHLNPYNNEINKKNQGNYRSVSPRRNKYNADADLSPPRWIKHEDLTPPRRSKEYVNDSSSSTRYEKSNKSPRTSRYSKENSSNSETRNYGDIMSPKKNSRHTSYAASSSTQNNNPISEPSRSERRYDNVIRKSRWDNEENDPKDDEDHQRDGKLRKTLDGKAAGLQNAQELVRETQAFKMRENDLFNNMSVEISGANASTIVRDKKTGKKRNLHEEAEQNKEKQKRQAENQEKYNKWGKGMKQVEDYNEKLKEDLHEMNKPLARYADDEDLEKYLKEQEREGDPMLNYIRKKKKKDTIKEGKPVKPQYEGEFMPNRYGIRPGHRWDGVNRSNGYEKKWFETQNAKKANQEEIYKWSTEDM